MVSLKGESKRERKNEKEERKSEESKPKESKKDKKKKKIPQDYFVRVNIIIYAIFIGLFTIFTLFAIIPEIFLAEAIVDNAFIFGILVLILLLVNLLFAGLTYQLCKKHELSTKGKWVGQSVITGFFSYRLLKKGVDT